MPTNRNALIRYTTIDNCLRNRHRLWTLEDLIDACSDALYEYEGIDKGVSRRTVQSDIQVMRSEKLGYNAPIIVKDKKHYTYEDPDYSIKNIPLTDQDLNHLNEAVEILKQFKGFTHFQELSGMVHRLEDKIKTSKGEQRAIIDFEKNEKLKGLEFIDPIYKTIQNGKTIEITYQSFKARQAQTFVFHPFLLKEHRNRWFIIGKRKAKNPTLILALDRVIDLKENNTPCISFDPDYYTNYFNDVIGVTVNEGENPEEVRFIAPHSNAPYIETKPFHHSQKVIERTDEGVVFSIFVQHNFELERDILAQGERIKIISPNRLRNIIRERIQGAVDVYSTDLDPKLLRHFPKRLESKGYIISNHVYSRKIINVMGKLFRDYKDEHPELKNDQVYAIRKLFKEIPKLKEVCLNNNLKKIISSFGEGLFLTKALYFDKPPQSNWYVTWHQDIPINVADKIVTEGFSGWTNKKGVISVIPPEEILKKTVTIRIHLDDTTSGNGALKIIPGSHKKIHSDEAIQTITESSIPATMEIQRGGVQLMKPLLLHASSKSTNQKHRRVIHLEFNSIELPNGLEWAEKEEVNY